MEPLPRSRCRGLLRAASACLAASALALPARAASREVLLRFLPPDSQVTGYMAYATDDASQVEEAFDLGSVAPDADGVARATIELDAERSYLVGMTAYNDAGESPISNQIHVAATAPVCDPSLCDDGDPCSADSCDAAGCFSSLLPDGTPCDDGYVDTVDDQCAAGACEGVLLACRDDGDCDDGDVCNGSELCDGGSVCLEGTPLDCGAPTACAAPWCDPLEGCQVAFDPDGTPCEDGLAETTGDVCQAGLCLGSGAGPDADADAVPDGLDNCLEAPNGDQRDDDADGFGTVCDADFDNDLLIGLTDMQRLADSLGQRCGQSGYDPALDVNGDCTVGLPDFAALAGSLGVPPGPSGLSCAGTVPCQAR